MIKSGLKNYFVNLKYYFTPVGTLAVGMILGLSIFIPGVISVISSLIDDIIVILQTNNLDFVPVKDFLVTSITALDWSDPIESLLTMISREWLNEVLNGSLDIIVSELELYSEQIASAVNGSLAQITALFAVFITFSVLGLICGFILTKFLVRRNMARRGMLKFILATIVDSVLSSALIILSVWLGTVWKPSIAITSLLTLVAFYFVSLLGAYLIHGRGKVGFRQVINVRNIFKLLLVNFIIFYISVIFALIAILLTNVFAGLFIGFAFVEIAFIVITLNAEGYVTGLVSVAEQPREELI